MFMHTGDRTRACRLRVPEIPENWKVASALPGKRGEYTTDSYHELVDCPTIMGKDIHTVSFEVLGKPMHVHFAGRWDGNEEMDKQIQRDFAAIAREQAAIFGGELPFEEYHHIYFLVPYYYRHAVEHKNSAMYVLPETHGQSPQKLRGLYGITSHEFFHVWNVKRIRPSAMWPYDYSQEAPTRLHWFTEGVTDYYAYIALTRAEVWDQDDYFGHISNLLTRLENDHGPTETAPSESSFNSWLARSDYHHPHHRASYYALGTRVALLLDMRIRTVTDGQRSFDDVFRLLWDLYYQKDRGVPEDGVLDAINTVAEADLSADYEALVNGTAPIDYARYLEPVNLNVQITQTPEVAGHKKLGIEKLGKMSDFVTLQTIHPESDAFKAGLMEGDILIAFNGKTVDQNSAESVFEGIEVGNTYRMKVQRWHEALTFDVTYTGESVPVKAELVDQAPSKERYNWLETHFKGIKAGTEPESAR
jgi:predicted metalloprotease with PDZ domain